MKQNLIRVNITKEDIGYSATAFVGDDFIATEAENFESLKKNIIDALNLNFQNEDKSLDDLKLNYDLESFFDFYKVINAKVLSERIGMNQSLLAQYIKGIKKPSQKQTKRIVDGVREIGKELSEVNLSP